MRYYVVHDDSAVIAYGQYDGSVSIATGNKVLIDEPEILMEILAEKGIDATLLTDNVNIPQQAVTKDIELSISDDSESRQRIILIRGIVLRFQEQKVKIYYTVRTVDFAGEKLPDVDDYERNFVVPENRYNHFLSMLKIGTLKNTIKDITNFLDNNNYFD